MIPVLYKADEMNFDTNGIGNLADAVRCEVYEERNGRFELELEYPSEGIHSELISEDMLIKAKANDKDGFQIFRIVTSQKKLNKVQVWKAEHISYDALYLPVRQPSIANMNADEAMNYLLMLTPLKHKFSAYSNITTKNSTTIDTVVSVRNALVGVEGSILDVYGGEYKFDNWDINLYEHRGAETGVEIRYGKNLIDAKMEKNIANTVTALYPYATYCKDDGTTVLVTLDEQIIYCPNVNKYPVIKCLPYDFTFEFEGNEVTQDMLRKKAIEYANSGIDIPDICITVKKANIESDIEVYEKLGLCDIVTVYISKLGINAKAKVVAYKYDVIKESYSSIQLGSFRHNLAKDMAAVEKKVEANLEDARRKILLKVSRGDVSNQLSIEEKGIEIKGNRIAIKSDYFELSADGKMVAKEGEFEGTVKSKNAIITGGTLDVGGNFSVDSDGKMVAKEGEFEGSITSKNANITGGTLEVGEKFNVTSDGTLTSSDGIFKGSLMAYNDISVVHRLNGVNIFEPYKFVAVASGNGTSTQTINDHIGMLIKSQSVGANQVYTERTWNFESIMVSGTKSRLAPTENYNHRLLYCYETPTPYFGDIGEGITDIEGKCYVAIDDVFSETIDSECDYQVFLQPYGEGQLYVVDRNTTYFVVQGTANMRFGWEVKAIQKDFNVYRLDEPVRDEVIADDYASDTYSYIASMLYDAEKESEDIQNE